LKDMIKIVIKDDKLNMEWSELNPWFVSSRYMFLYVICFRIIHFILISTVHALILTCLPVSISGT
jgi:hypothetical protein